MFAWILQLLASPIIKGLLDAYKIRQDSLNTQGAQTVDVAKAVLSAEIEARKEARAIIIAEQGRWWTALPRAVVQYSFAAFVFKVVVWDNLLGLGTTDPLGGDVGVWAGWVMGLWFGGRTVEKVATTIWGRR
jgi:hypothetical protein